MERGIHDNNNNVTQQDNNSSNASMMMMMMGTARLLRSKNGQLFSFFFHFSCLPPCLRVIEVTGVERSPRDCDKQGERYILYVYTGNELREMQM